MEGRFANAGDAARNDYLVWVEELDALTDKLASIPQKVGFVHKFFVPGVIGTVQERIVGFRMSKAAGRELCDGMNYCECGEKITALVSKACAARRKLADAPSGGSLCNLRILASASNAVDAWVNVYPEIAFWVWHGGYGYSAPSVIAYVQERVRGALSSVMELPPDSFAAGGDSTFGRSMRPRNNKAAIACNLLLVLLVAALWLFLS